MITWILPALSIFGLACSALTMVLSANSRLDLLDALANERRARKSYRDMYFEARDALAVHEEREKRRKVGLTKRWKK